MTPHSDEVTAPHADEEVDEQPLLVLGIGAPAGSLDPLLQVIRGCSAEKGLCILIAQHMAPDRRSLMPELIARETPLPVKTAVHGEPVRSGTLYINPSNCNIGVAGGRFALSGPDPDQRPIPSIDRFFAALAGEYGSKTVVIALAGDTRDGVDGCRAIRHAN